MIILLTITFFTKSNITKAVVIWFFAIKLIIVPLQINYLYQISPEIAISPDTIRMVGSLFWAIIFLFYFIFSTRVKKTFVKQEDLGGMIRIALIAPVILGIIYITKINDISDRYSLRDKAIFLGNENLDYDDIKAKYYYDKAIKLVEYHTYETIEIANQIADKYFDKKDYFNAIYFYQIAVDKNDKMGVDKIDNWVSFNLAYSYSETKDYNNAIKYYEDYLANNQYEGAMRNLGLVYERVKKYKKAQQWFKNAFDIYIIKGRDGDKEAAKWLALMYRYGEGVTKDTKKAKYWENKSK